jgi:hypothetical protein
MYVPSKDGRMKTHTSYKYRKQNRSNYPDFLKFTEFCFNIKKFKNELGHTFVTLIDYLGFYVPLKNISLIWRRHHCHCRWRAAKFRPMLGAQGLWAGRDLYRATPAVTRDLGFSAPFSRLLRYTRGCGGSILTRILSGKLLLQIFTS